MPQATDTLWHVLGGLDRGNPSADCPQQSKVHSGVVQSLSGNNRTLRIDDGEVTTIYIAGAQIRHHERIQFEDLSIGDCSFINLHGTASAPNATRINVATVRRPCLMQSFAANKSGNPQFVLGRITEIHSRTKPAIVTLDCRSSWLVGSIFEGSFLGAGVEDSRLAYSGRIKVTA